LRQHGAQRLCLRAYVFRSGGASIAVEASMICSLERPENAALLLFNAGELHRSSWICGRVARACVEPSSVLSLLSEALDRVRGSMIRSSVKGFRKSKLHLIVPFLGRKIGVSSNSMLAIAILEKAIALIRSGEFSGEIHIPIEVACGENPSASSPIPSVDRAVKYLAENDAGARSFIKKLCEEATQRTS